MRVGDIVNNIHVRKLILPIAICISSFIFEFAVVKLMPNNMIYAIICTVIYRFAISLWFCLIYNRKLKIICLNQIRFDKYLLRFAMFFLGFWFTIFIFTHNIAHMNDFWQAITPRFIRDYQKHAGYAFYIQTLYYLLEAFVVTVLIALFQMLGDLSRTKLPFAAICISLTWGALHILSQGLSDGIFIFICSFVLGFSYSVCNKQPVFTFLLLLNMFLL